MRRSPTPTHWQPSAATPRSPPPAPSTWPTWACGFVYCFSLLACLFGCLLSRGWPTWACGCHCGAVLSHLLALWWPAWAVVRHSRCWCCYRLALLLLLLTTLECRAHTTAVARPALPPAVLCRSLASTTLLLPHPLFSPPSHPAPPTHRPTPPLQLRIPARGPLPPDVPQQEGGSDAHRTPCHPQRPGPGDEGVRLPVRRLLEGEQGLWGGGRG